METKAAIHALRTQGIEEPCINILVEIYSGLTAMIESEKKRCKVGRHNLLNGIHHVFTGFRTSDREELEMRFKGEYLSNLQFADCIALISNSGGKTQLMITELERKTGK